MSMHPPGSRFPSRSRWLTAGMGIFLLSLALLGSPGCGCGCDDEPPTTGGECCCVFIWTPPTYIPAGNVQINIVAQTPGLNATITPNPIVNVAPGQDVTFEVCVDADHPLNATLTLQFVPLGGAPILGGMTLRYPVRCQPILEPNPDTKIYSPDCGYPDPCCCSYIWTPEPNLQNDTVQVILENATAGLNPVLPAQLFNVSQGVPIQFEVCVDANHPVPASMQVSLEWSKGLYAGSFTLVWNERCDPDVIPGIRTPIYSPNCGDIPQCCCTIEWFRETSASGDVTVRVEFVNVNATLNPTATPPTQMVGVGGVGVFEVCVNANHDIDATMEMRIVDTSNNAILATIVLGYDPPCIANNLQSTGGGFEIFCLEPNGVSDN